VRIDVKVRGPRLGQWTVNCLIERTAPLTASVLIWPDSVAWISTCSPSPRSLFRMVPQKTESFKNCVRLIDYRFTRIRIAAEVPVFRRSPACPPTLWTKVHRRVFWTMRPLITRMPQARVRGVPIAFSFP